MLPHLKREVAVTFKFENGSQIVKQTVPSKGLVDLVY
jgi:hypothetical protein